MLGSVVGTYKSRMFEVAMNYSSSEMQRAIKIMWLYLVLFSSFEASFEIFGTF
jgi:hypothetical protein